MPDPKRRLARRGRRRTPPAASPAPPADDRLLGLDLKAWAGPAVAEAGRKYALLGRVLALRLAPDGASLEARVRGNRPAPHRVVVRLEDGAAVSECTCSYQGGPGCRHAVAALEALRFPLTALHDDPAHGRRRRTGRRSRGQGRIIQEAPAQPGYVLLGEEQRTLTKQERLDLARENEIVERRQRARRERATVRPLPADGLPPRFLVGRRGSAGPYLVTLRGAKQELGACTCPDFAQSELGTCKHVERARGWYLRKKKAPVAPVLSLWWSPRTWVDAAPDPLREIRIEPPEEGLPAALAGFFDSRGWLRRVPDGDSAPAWVRRAIAASRGFALLTGRLWDEDPAVAERFAEAERELRRTERLSAIGDAAWEPVRSRLGYRLHAYQDHGVRFLARTGRAFLADDMGLGKTVQAIAACLLLRRAAGVRRFLVVCPASLKYQWHNEIANVAGERAVVVEGRRSLREEAYRRWRDGFLVLNYELVLRDLDLLRAAPADVVVLDEAQRIKNWDTKTAKATKQLESPFAFVLTGTPLENRLAELHSLVEFLHPRALGPRWRLLPYHAVIDPQGRVVAYEDLVVLRSRLKPFFLRRERATVLDQLPDRTENTFWTGMTPAQMRPYRKHAARVAKLIARGGTLGPAEVRTLLQALTTMRILCNSLAQHRWDRFRDRVAAPPRRDDDLRWLQSPKTEEFVDVMDEVLEHDDSKVVVFSQWERALLIAQHALRPTLERRGERAGLFHGGLDARTRHRVLEEFRTDPAMRVLFSTDAGGLGLNLQDAASIVVHLEVPWNPAVLEQRVARVHRLGQRRSVQVLHFVTRGTIEERVRRVVEGKRALFEGLLVEGADRVEFNETGRATIVEQVRHLIGDDSEEEEGVA